MSTTPSKKLSALIKAMTSRLFDLKFVNTRKLADGLNEICGLAGLARSNREAIKLEVDQRTDEFEDHDGSDGWGDHDGSEECEAHPDTSLKKKLNRTKKYSLPLLELLETLRTYQELSGERVTNKHVSTKFATREALFKRINNCLNRLATIRAAAKNAYMDYLRSFDRRSDIMYDTVSMGLTQREHKDNVLEALQIFWTRADAFSSLFPALIADL